MTDAASSRSRRPAAGTQSAAHSTGIERTRAFQLKLREIQRIANDLLEQSANAGTFSREIFGLGGAISRLFNTRQLMKAFKESAEYAELNRISAELRSQDAARVAPDREPTRVITVRLPRSVHEALRAEASAREISMNKLCISKLLQELDVAANVEQLDE